MSERMNGRGASYIRNTRGSDRRGVVPVPSVRIFEQQEQSKQDKEALLARIRERHEATLGLGNRDLPAFKHKHELVENIEAYKAVIVGGATGSGKSTQLPQYLYEAGYDMTVVLVPRRVIADGLGDRLRDEFAAQLTGVNTEELVGIVHGERAERHEDNKVLVMTPNTYVRMEDDLKERFGDKKVAIIADEIHEANIFTEIATGVAAMSVMEREDWRLIAASATHNTATLQGPFQEINNGFVPMIEIEGRPSELTQYEEPDLDPIQVYGREAEHHERAMIFTCGKKEIDHIIEEAARELERNEKGSSARVIFRKLHGELTERELLRINDPVPEGYRLCIVSSPAGMSGITIPGVTLVVSDGTINRSVLDEEGVSGLRRQYLSRAGITQQFGRAGRDVAGGVGILAAPVNARGGGLQSRMRDIDENEFIFLPFKDRGRDEHEPPEILNSNLSRVTLSVAGVNRRLHGINPYMPHSVQENDILMAEEGLARLGMLDDDAAITDIGRKADVFPVIPELGRGLVEAMGPGRRIEALAHAAFMAAAVDVGGIHERKGSPYYDEKAVRQYIRPTSQDDFMVQLDLMNGVHGASSERERTAEELRAEGLSPKRVERARKVARKILATAGIQLRNVVAMQPLPDEEQQLRDDFTAGFLDSVFENVGREPRTHKLQFRNIHGSTDAKRRVVDDASFAAIAEGTYIAGIPRYHIDQKTGHKHDLVGFVMPVDPKVVGAWAVQNEISNRHHLESRMENGEAVDYNQVSFGSIMVGGRVRSDVVGHVSEHAQAHLIQYLQENPGESLRAYRDIVKRLEKLRDIIPEADILRYRRKDAQPDATQEDITKLLQKIVKKTSIAYEADEMIRREIFSHNISLSRYYSPESLNEMYERSPSVYPIAGVPTTIYYDKGEPYVTVLTRAQKRATNEALYLPDGREILLQRVGSGGKKERVSMASLAPVR